MSFCMISTCWARTDSEDWYVQFLYASSYNARACLASEISLHLTANLSTIRFNTSSSGLVIPAKSNHFRKLWKIGETSGTSVDLVSILYRLRKHRHVLLLIELTKKTTKTRQKNTTERKDDNSSFIVGWSSETAFNNNIFIITTFPAR